MLIDVEVQIDGKTFSVMVDTRVLGRYYPQTLETPAEEPEVEWDVKRVCLDGHELQLTPELLKAVEDQLDTEEKYSEIWQQAIEAEFPSQPEDRYEDYEDEVQF